MSTAVAGPVVAGVDGSEEALRAVGWAAHEVLSMRRSLRLVHASVWPLVRHPAPPGVPVNFRRTMQHQAARWLEQAKEVAERTVPASRIVTEVCTGAAGPVLLDEATRAREVVIGSRGLGGITGMLVGSTAATLIRRRAG